MTRAFTTLTLLILIGGCRQEQPESADTLNRAIRFSPEGVKIMTPIPGQRFTPTSSPLVSYDTGSGELCKTYEWGERDNGIDSCYRILEVEANRAMQAEAAKAQMAKVR